MQSAAYDPSILHSPLRTVSVPVSSLTSADQLTIVRAENDLLITADGTTYTDLLAGYGTVWLGHCHPGITQRVEAQLHQVWITAKHQAPVMAEAKTLIEQVFPSAYQLGGFYSTGMEGTEFALRVARAVTGKAGVVGFAKSMHGKSLATAYLGWDNHDGVVLPAFQRLPFIPHCAEAEILDQLQLTLKTTAISAVFIEPLQGSGGGYQATPEFYRQVASLCHDYGALLVFDEVLTGFYRTGSAFCFEALGVSPDIVVVGKSMGNGFPVSGVMVKRAYPIEKKMFPGSTYSGNPIACAAIAATLDHMQRLEMPIRVGAIEHTILDHLGDFPRHGIALRGQGALWILELPPQLKPLGIPQQLLQRGIVVSSIGSFIRLLPASTISLERLSAACATIREICLSALAHN